MVLQAHLGHGQQISECHGVMDGAWHLSSTKQVLYHLAVSQDKHVCELVHLHAGLGMCVCSCIFMYEHVGMKV